MKLLEIAPDFVRSQIGTLLTILQHLQGTMGKGDEGVQTAKVPMDAVVKLMNNAGYSFNYGDFVKLYNEQPRISELVSNFNQQEITIGQDIEADIPSDQEQGQDTVDQMAKSAAKNINSPM